MEGVKGGAYRACWRKDPQQRLMSIGNKVTLRRGGEEEPGKGCENGKVKAEVLTEGIGLAGGDWMELYHNKLEIVTL